MLQNSSNFGANPICLKKENFSEWGKTLCLAPWGVLQTFSSLLQMAGGTGKLLCLYTLAHSAHWDDEVGMTKEPSRNTSNTLKISKPAHKSGFKSKTRKSKISPLKYSAITILLLFMFWCLGHKACGIFALWRRSKPTPYALEGKVFSTDGQGSPGNTL